MTLSPHKKQTGRKAKLLDVEMMARLRDALIVGHTIRNACVMAGISDKSYHRWLKEADLSPEGHPLREFRESVKEARAIAEHRMVLMIQEAAKKHWQAAAWWLERRCSEDWGKMRPVKIRGGG